ncbi:integrin alpha-PS3-like [Drosophila rhopaloa]|uniref:Integrin alpha-PS3-like n=1 Tax=Drosophila rhopaloa TaxID=1041015 RepID=A0A6P4E3A9_DRORH|nr:integrin alpha-PS3-like [Drosophila rhopaloa]
MCRLLLLVFLALQYNTEAFNISPSPNQVKKFPNLKTHLKQTRSSYFGYTLVIRNTSIIVGAPRAQSTIEPQNNINETGAIYWCPLTNDACSPYVLDSEGNVNASRKDEYHSIRKDFQWLGGSMDGGTRDTDKLLVCAPRLYAQSIIQNNNYMNGVCYWLQNTTNSSNSTLKQVNRISPLRAKNMQVVNDSYYYIMAELGLSAHVTDNNLKFLIGAPGIDTWRGSVILVEDVASKKNTPEYHKTHVLQPKNWQQPYDSTFGYAVSSGYFDSLNTSHLLYVATAPHANNRSGEAYIFDVRGESIQRYKDFRGEKFGEYFGYSVLAEDLNGDGKTDVIISAPFHSLDGCIESGAVYVFINKGLYEFDLKILRSPLKTNARFGTTLSRLGDINHDGYYDVAVGAPFAGNGSVFIYLGGEFGLRDQPSQRLDAPSQQPSKYGSHMFGHGLSRGLDIDGNGFNDFAIGAPNAEAVYLYRTYPVVKIHASLRLETRQIKPEQEKVKITACFRLSTTAKEVRVQKQELVIRVTIDKKLNRAWFVKTQHNEMILRKTASPDENCTDFDIQLLHSKYIFVPIDLNMHYELTQKIPHSSEFCETCAIVDPKEPKSCTEAIVFITGCASEVCVADLEIRSKNLSSTFILGTADTIGLSYEITNNGETAYLPQFNVTSTPRLAFSQVPGNCKVADAVMVCDLNRGQPLAKGDSDSVTISFDVSYLRGQSLIIHAEVFSTGYEKNSTDNQHIDKISLTEFTEIEASGAPINGQTVLKHYPYSAEIINHYEIRSGGPSTIEELTLSFYIPVAYKANDSMEVIHIINITSLKTQATYDSQSLSVALYDQNNTLLNGYPFENVNSSAVRRRRDLSQEANAQLNELLIEDIPPKDRSIVLDCRETNMTICIRAEMLVQFRPSKPINLNISFNVDLREVKDHWEYFVIMTDLKLLKKGDLKSESFQINRKFEPNVIYKPFQLVIWIIIIAVIGGLLLVAALCYALHKFGFFKRGKKQELKKLIRESFQVLDEVEEEEEALNTEEPEAFNIY